MHGHHLCRLAQRSLGRAAAKVWRQLIHSDHRTAAEEDRPFDNVPQLADVAWPRVHLEQLHRLLGKTSDLSPPIGRKLPQERLGEQWDILPTLPQRRQMDGDGVDPEVKILAKPPLANLFLERAHRGRDDPHIDVDGSIGPEAFYLSLLENPQKLDLEGQRKLTDFVEEKGPLARRLETPDSTFAGAGEGALLEAEELGLDERFRQRGTAHPEIGFGAPRRVEVNGRGDHLLAGAAFTVNDHRGVRIADQSDEIEDLPHWLGLADDVGKRVPLFELRLQANILLAENAYRADVAQTHDQLGH